MNKNVLFVKKYCKDKFKIKLSDNEAKSLEKVRRLGINLRGGAYINMFYTVVMLLRSIQAEMNNGFLMIISIIFFICCLLLDYFVLICGNEMKKIVISPEDLRKWRIGSIFYFLLMTPFLLGIVFVFCCYINDYVLYFYEKFWDRSNLKEKFSLIKQQ